MRDVVRLVMSRPTRDPREGELLAALLAQLGTDPSAPPGCIPEVARAVRPDWVDALSRLPGWEGLATPAAIAARLLDLARLLPDEARALITDLLMGDIKCP